MPRSHLRVSTGEDNTRRLTSSALNVGLIPGFSVTFARQLTNGPHDGNTSRATVCCLSIVATVVADAAVDARQTPANPAHAHIGHVMTSWKDTPEMKGFLPTAIADAQVALEQAERAHLEGRIDFVLYGGYVLNVRQPHTCG